MPSRGYFGMGPRQRGELDEGSLHGRGRPPPRRGGGSPLKPDRCVPGVSLIPTHEGRVRPGRRPARTRARGARDWGETYVSARSCDHWLHLTRCQGGPPRGSRRGRTRWGLETIGLRTYHPLLPIHPWRNVPARRPPENARNSPEELPPPPASTARAATRQGALRLFGESPPVATPRSDAEDDYRGALALAGELGMRPLVAHCHLGLGKLYRRTGKTRAGGRTPHHRDDDVPRDGHAVLAGSGGGGGTTRDRR